MVPSVVQCARTHLYEVLAVIHDNISERFVFHVPPGTIQLTMIEAILCLLHSNHTTFHHNR